MDRDDLAFAGLARHADLIAAGELSSRELTELFLAPDRPPGPAAERVPGRAAASRRWPRPTRPTRAAARATGGRCSACRSRSRTTSTSRARSPPTAATPTRRPGRPTPRSCARLRAAGAVIIGKTHVPELMATAVHRVADVRRHPQPVGPAPDVRRLERRLAPPRSRPGLASAALGTDGAGSIRIPAACCGLFGLKPQRGRISTAPEVDPHRGMTVFGPLTRTRRGRRAGSWTSSRTAARRSPRRPRPSPGKLRIAVSIGLPPLGVKPDAEQLGAVEATAARLRELGHEVSEREFDWGLTIGNRVLARFVRGVGDKARRARPPRPALAPRARARADRARRSRAAWPTRRGGRPPPTPSG